jgi:hypothetical protein
MWDVTNPAVPVPDTEVYARYVTFDQPHDSRFQLDTEGCKKLSGILRAIRIFEFALPTMIDWTENDGTGELLCSGWGETRALHKRRLWI